MLRVLIVAGLLLGCGDKKTPEGEAKTKQPATAEKATEKASPTPEKAKPAPPLKPLIADAKAGLPKPLSDLSFGMGRAEVEKAVPQLVGKESFRPEGFDGVEIGVVFHSKRDELRYIWARLPPRAEADLKAAWGEPVQAKLGRTRPALFWLDAGRGVQAILAKRLNQPDAFELELWPYTPWQTLLGPDKAKLGFETEPLLGMTPEQVAAKYARYQPKLKEGRVDLWLPPHEYRTAPTRARLTVTDGKVSLVYFKVDYSHHPPMGPKIVDAAKAKWGEPAEADENKLRFELENAVVKVRHDDVAQQVQFTVGPKAAE